MVIPEFASVLEMLSGKYYNANQDGFICDKLKQLFN